MKYQGSKNRLSKYLLPIILDQRGSDQFYVEPFAGGFNMIDKVNGKRIANDLNYYVVMMFRAIRDGWNPPDSICHARYMHIKNNKKRSIFSGDGWFCWGRMFFCW